MRKMTALGSRIVVAKASRIGTPPLVWAQWQPSGLDALAWDDTCGIYFAHLPERRRSRLEASVSLEPARERSLYRFDGTRFGCRDEPSLSSLRYVIRNEADFAGAFGLIQTGSINGKSFTAPMNCAILGPTVTAEFSSHTSRLYVWITEDAPPGNIIATLPARSTAVEINPSQRNQRLKFDDELSMFAAGDRYDPLPRIGGQHDIDRH